MIKVDKHLLAFSSFPPAMIWEKRNRSLLVQFILSELITAYKCLCRHAPIKELLTSEKRFFPYDWAYPYGHLNKAQEHALALSSVFPELPGPVIQFEQILSKLVSSPQHKSSLMKARCTKSLPELLLALEPFIEGCKENENLIFFLLKHKEEIDQCIREEYLHTLLLKLHPAGLRELCEKLCDNYHDRGFYFLIPEIKLLMAQFVS